MRLPSEIRFADPKVKEAFYRLEKCDNQEKELFKVINQAFDKIEANAFCGIQIPKNLIPKEYIQEYRIKNLWKYNLPKGWRLIYSVLADEIIVVSLVLEWFGHKEYERRFKY